MNRRRFIGLIVGAGVAQALPKAGKPGPSEIPAEYSFSNVNGSVTTTTISWSTRTSEQILADIEDMLDYVWAARPSYPTSIPFLTSTVPWSLSNANYRSH